MEIITKAILNKIFKEVFRSDDPFKTHTNIPKIGEVRGVGGAEAAADEVYDKLREAGVDPKDIDYVKIVNDIEKGVLKDGLPLEKVKDSVFDSEKKRIGAKTTDPTPPREENRPKDPLPDEKDPPKDSAPSEKDPIDPSDSDSENSTKKIGTGTDAGDNDLDTPEARKFMDDLLKPGKPVDEVMLKDPRDLTEGEAKEIMIARMDATTNDERERLFKIEKGFFDHFFDIDPAKRDAVGNF